MIAALVDYLLNGSRELRLWTPRRAAIAEREMLRREGIVVDHRI